MKNTRPADVDTYLEGFPETARKAMEEIRSSIKRTAPDAEEGISYGMPAYKYKGKPLVYFAAFKKHIGFYATPNGHEAFREALSAYKQGKGSVQFPLDQPMPLDLVENIVRFRMSGSSS